MEPVSGEQSKVSAGAVEGQTQDRIMLGGWWLRYGPRTKRRLEVVADAGGIEPIEVLFDGRPVALIDRPTVNTGRRTKTRSIDGAELRVNLDSPDDGATIECQVFIDGHRLSPTDPEVDLADFVPKGQRRAWEAFLTVSVAATVGYLLLSGLFGLVDDLGLRDRGPLVIGTFVAALALLYGINWRLQRPVSDWIDAREWSTVRTRAAWVAFFAAQLAAFGCFLIVAGRVLRSF